MTIGSISSGKEILRPVWMQWLIPSTGDLIFVALLGLLVYTALAVRLLGDAGIGWHIRTGQLILATHAIPHADPFSSTMSGQPWFAWEWLYDVLVGWLDNVAGLNGVVFFTASIIALTFSWTFRLLLRRRTSFPVALVLVLLAASASMIHFFARPHVVSWLFTVVWFCVLDSSTGTNHDSDAPNVREHSRYLWLLPLSMILWANIHGGFLLGFVLLAIYWLAAIWEGFRLKEGRIEDALRKIRAAKRIRDLTLIGLLSAVATLANPYGWKLHVHIYHYLSNRFLMDHIDEFQSPNFHGVAQKCFAALLLLTLIAFAAKRRETAGVRFSEALIILFAVYSGLYAARNIPVSGLLLILVIGPRLSDALQSLGQRRTALDSTSPPFFQRMQNIEGVLHGHFWPIAALALTCWIIFHGGALGTKQLVNAHFDANRFPSHAVDYFKSQNLPGPILAPDSWGGYLIYRLYPRVKVAVDDRHDFYGEQFLKSYLKMMHVEPGWENFLEQYPVRYILISKGSALANILAETPHWQPVYSDDVAIAFASTSPNIQ
ncbi:MAG: hypothetical protein WA437_19480 [Candidatus Sulfotelmatobacter sp.]